MLSNEQRAHDLALAMLKFTMNNPEILQPMSGEEAVRIDFHVASEYAKLYRIFLDAMNHEFPSEP
ncbi:MAG: hypothetical protein HFJ84_09115 [Clostridiales bacterium]|jgi:hypothetical protein|nr:hypothetical protein [Clostridiales bacterium]